MLGAFLAASLLLAATASPDAVVRSDHFVEGEGGIRLFVREVRASAPATPKRTPILLLHGARVPGVASFDLPVPGGSLAADLAAAGHPVYVMDLRGYGRSTRPPEMSQPPEANPPLVRSVEAVRDVDAVVEWIAKRTGAKKIDLFGWATGGHWLGFYATLHPERVAHLVVLNTLYGGTDGHPMLGRGSDLEDKENPGRPAKSLGAYRWSTARVASVRLGPAAFRWKAPTSRPGGTPPWPRPTSPRRSTATRTAGAASPGPSARRAERWRTASTSRRAARSGTPRWSSRRRSCSLPNGISGRGRRTGSGCAPSSRTRLASPWS